MICIKFGGNQIDGFLKLDRFMYLYHVTRAKCAIIYTRFTKCGHVMQQCWLAHVRCTRTLMYWEMFFHFYLLLLMLRFVVSILSSAIWLYQSLRTKRCTCIIYILSKWIVIYYHRIIILCHDIYVSVRIQRFLLLFVFCIVCF